MAGKERQYHLEMLKCRRKGFFVISFSSLFVVFVLCFSFTEITLFLYWETVHCFQSPQKTILEQNY